MARATTAGKGARVPLEIEVRNFGPISRGKFRLKPLTVFVGPNNSGKTFAAKLAHAVISSRGEFEHPLDYAEWVRRKLKDPKFKALVVGMEEIVASAGSNGTRIPGKYLNRVRDLVLGRYFVGNLPETIIEVFGADLKDLVRIGSKMSTINVKYHISANMSIQATGQAEVELDVADISYTVRNQQGEIAIYETDNQAFGQDVNLNMLDGEVKREIGRVARALRIQKNTGLYYLLCLMKRIDFLYGYLPTSQYFPAGRSGFMAAQIPIVSSMMKNSRFSEASRRQIEPTSGVVSEYIDSLVHMGDYVPSSNGKSRQDMFADMFGGELKVIKPKAGLPRIVYRLGSKIIPLNLLSSSITETASLQLFKQHVNDASDVLVLEEPEAHLHPTNQAKLAKHIARLVNRGTHVLLITHGLFFLEHLSMLVKISRISAGERKKLGYMEEDCINNDDVAAYLFKNASSGGHTINELEHSPDDGISQDEFGRVMEIMCNKEIQIGRLMRES